MVALWFPLARTDPASADDFVTGASVRCAGTAHDVDVSTRPVPTTSAL